MYNLEKMLKDKNDVQKIKVLNDIFENIDCGCKLHVSDVLAIAKYVPISNMFSMYDKHNVLILNMFCQNVFSVDVNERTLNLTIHQDNGSMSVFSDYFQQPVTHAILIDKQLYSTLTKLTLRGFFKHLDISVDLVFCLDI